MAATKLSVTVGNNIKNLRLAQVKGQTQVANELGISVAALSKIENGLTDLNLSRLAQIAKYFNVQLVALITNGDLISTQLSGVDVEKYQTLLDEKDTEILKLQRKVIALYEKLDL